MLRMNLQISLGRLCLFLIFFFSFASMYISAHVETDLFCENSYELLESANETEDFLDILGDYLLDYINVVRIEEMHEDALIWFTSEMKHFSELHAQIYHDKKNWNYFGCADAF